MKLCPKCGNMLVPGKRGHLKCRSCDYSTKDKIEIKEKIDLKKEKTGHVENVETYPKTDAECPKCDNEKAYWWIQGTRAADEPETTFYKCTKCGHVWRDYL